VYFWLQLGIHIPQSGLASISIWSWSDGLDYSAITTNQTR